MMPRTKDHVRKKKEVANEKNEHGINAHTLGKANRVRNMIDSDPALKEKMELAFAVMDGAMSLLKEKDHELENARQHAEVVKVLAKEKADAEVKAEQESERAAEERKRVKELTTATTALRRLVHQLRDDKLSFGDTPDLTNLLEAERERLRALTATLDHLIPNSKAEEKKMDAFDVARAVALRVYAELRGVGMSEAKARRRETAVV